MRLLEHWKQLGLRAGVLMNEAGEISIDGPRVGTIAEQVMNLAGGCVCCDTKEDLSWGIAQLVRDYGSDLIVLEGARLGGPGRGDRRRDGSLYGQTRPTGTGHRAPPPYRRGTEPFERLCHGTGHPLRRRVDPEQAGPLCARPLVGIQSLGPRTQPARAPLGDHPRTG